MAVAEHNVSRRALLGAAFAAPLLGHPLPRHPLLRHPGLDPGSPFASRPPQDREIPDQRAPQPLRGNGEARSRNDELTFAVTKWDRALASLRRAEAALAAAAGTEDEDLYGDRVVAFNRTVERLLAAPAPGLPALATKLTLAVREAAWELPAGDACMAALVRDAARLACLPL
jgi:hypothetical protein